MHARSYSGYSRRFRPGDATLYIKPLSTLSCGIGVVVCCRVSGYEQNRTLKLARQEAFLRRLLRRLGIKVVGVVRYIGSGVDPMWLARAVALAEPNDAALVAITPCRFARSPLYDKRAQDMQARKCELDYLRLVTEGRQLVTVADPSVTNAEARSLQTRVGQAVSGRRGGRPRRKSRRREALRPIALEMRANGASLRQIAAALSVPHSTVQGWCTVLPNRAK